MFGRGGRVLTAAVLGLLVLVPWVEAQVGDAVLEVGVVDEAQGSMPGATVTVSRPDTGFTRTAMTSEAGTVRLPALPPGTYRVQVELTGFTPIVQEGLTLRVGQTARLEVTMKVAALAETVTITAEAPLVDVYKTDSSTNIVPEQIQSLPVADRDFQRLAFLAPGVQRERGGFRFVSGGPVIGGSGNASQSTILVDGADFTDPTLGLARARFSQDAISEFRVITNRFDSEVGGSAGGGLSIVTKSGTNDWKGSAFGFYRADGLRSQAKFEKSKVDYSRGQYGFTLGGPLVKDQTHLFASLEQINEDNIALFRPGGAFADQAADVSHPLDQTLGYAGIDHKLSANQRLALKFAYERYREENFRVGGTSDESYGQQLNRDNWNLKASHVWTPGFGVNSLSLQVGKRKYTEPTNSTKVAEWFSSGNTLRTGTNIVGNLLGESTQLEIRDTHFLHASHGKATHDIRLGFSFQHIKDRFYFPVYENGLLIYLTDTRAVPLAYGYGVGSGDATIEPNLIAGFVQDDFRPFHTLTVSAGLRYDLDTAGNNPEFTHPLRPNARGKDSNNIQPRLAFSWDLDGKGRYVLRGGVGRFTGRFLLVPAFTELQQNGVTGRTQYTRLNGALFGVPALALDPANPENTGIRTAPNITLLAEDFEAPESTQASLGLTGKLGGTGLYLDLEGLYVKGSKEVINRDANFGGNLSPTRPNRSYNQIATYTNEGHSEYKALVASLNGTLFGKHLLTASLTLASKKNINDDFSPEFPFGYPNDPANIEAEYGPSRADERLRFVLSGVFKLPWDVTVAPIYEYGSGQPWNQRLGYDYNGDGYNSDRPAGVGRNSQDGPRFSQLSLRLSKKVAMGSRAAVEVIAEAFNVFDTVNYNVASLVDAGNGALYLSGPTLANPSLAYRPNPNYGSYTATLPPREIQLGLRLLF